MISFMKHRKCSDKFQLGRLKRIHEALKEKEGFWEWSPCSRQRKQYELRRVKVQRTSGERHSFLCGWSFGSM